MGVIVDPDTGALVSDAAAKADIDARIRVLTPQGDRPIDRDFGSLFLEAASGLPETLDALPASVQGSLSASPLYTVRTVRVVPGDGDTLSVDAEIRLSATG